MKLGKNYLIWFIACHKNGQNVIIPEKNLKFEALEENGMNNLDSIIYQI